MKNLQKPRIAVICSILFVLGMVTHSFALHFPDTIWVKTMFYDYKADGTNPNFEACNPGYKQGMIQNYLDAWKKPILKSNKACNDSVSQWFRISGAIGPDTPSTNFFFDPVKKEWKWSGLTNYKGRANEWVGPHHNDSTNKMSNILMYDSLPFRCIDTVVGMYEYNNQSFFKLDGKGYGAEGKMDGNKVLHNFGFSMEIHTFFTYTGGEVFHFTGDDDVWAFINGQLAMDIGGVHGARQDSIILDNVAATLNLVKGKTYPFDFFYAERHTQASTIRITTNLFKPKPSSIIVRPDTLPVNPLDTTKDLKDTTIVAGQCVKFNLHIVDDTSGLRPEYDSLIRWEIFDTLGNVVTFDTVSQSNRICVTKAYGCLKIRLYFQDPEDATNIIRDSVQLCVQQGKAHHLLIEGSPDAMVSPRNNNPLDNLTIPASVVKDTIFAVLRDPYGNFVNPSKNTQWSVLSGAGIISVTNGNTANGAGILTKIGPAGDAYIIAKDLDNSGAVFSDTIHIIASTVAYDSIRIVSGTGGQKVILSNVAITIGKDTTLRVEAHRVDGLGDHGWTNVSATWSTSTNLHTQTPAPVSDSIWKFTPTDTGAGSVTVRIGSLSSSITVNVKPGIANSLKLYPQLGAPSSQAPYFSNVTYTYQAGTAIPVFAKIFDPIAVWLSQYETDTSFSKYISWDVKDSATNTFTSAMGSLNVQNGNKTVFTPKMAFKTYIVTATFVQGATRLQSTMKIYAKAGAPSHIVIESSPDSASSPNADNRLSSIDIQASQTSQSVYAIIRDQYGNYVGHADSSLWSSNDTLIANVISGPRKNLGEATITRIAPTASQTWVYTKLGALTDSVDIRIVSITYDAVTIMTNSNGLKDLDTLVLRMDQDTTLFSLGKRSDTKNWTNVTVTWQVVTIATTPAAPSLASSFTFHPTAIGSGKIIIQRTGTGGAIIKDSIIAIFVPGLPQRLDLYKNAGQPKAADKYPDATVSDTIIAGDTITLFAKIFDQNALWLSEFEKNPSAITWHITELAGTPPTGSLLFTTGYTNKYTPTRANNAVYIVAELGINGVLLSDMVRLVVKAGLPDHVVIEATPNPTTSPTADNPISQLTYGPKDTVQYAYAVLRDKFGNFTGYLSQGIWESSDLGIAKVKTGTVANGEGVINRIGNSGNAFIVVHNTDFSFTDTIIVKLNSISYDSLRIVTLDNATINTLTMKTDKDTTLIVQGKRSDNGQWDFVPADWKIIGSATVDPLPPHAASNWTIVPKDTGKSIIVVSMGQSATDTISVTFTHGNPSKLVLFPGDNQSNQNTPLASPVSTIKIVAGIPFTLTARILDKNNIGLPEFESVSAPILWKTETISGDTTNDSLMSPIGYKNAYVTKTAYKTLNVIATFLLGTNTFSDTVQLSITPGNADHMVIEQNANWQTSPNNDNPLDSITITSLSTYGKVYAIIRDKFGNFISYSEHTAWISADTLIAKVEDGVASSGEGVINRVSASGRTTIKAQNIDNVKLFDSTIVILTSYYYKALRISTNQLSGIKSLSLSTNDDTTLFVQGLRSDTAIWEQTSAKWELIGAITTSIPVPDMASSWNFAPLIVAPGKIRVTQNNDSITKPDTVLVLITLGGPSKISITIITPANKRIAGDTILAVVKIQNKTGLIPGSYCISNDSLNGQMAYQTLLGNGSKPPAEIKVDGQKGILNTYPSTTVKTNECFKDGLDTIKIIIYNAPISTDSLQQIFVLTPMGLKASTESFILLAGQASTLRLEDSRGIDIGDSLKLHFPSESKTIFAFSYDKYGNKRIGGQLCSWTTGGTLHPLVNSTSALRIYYESSGVTGNESGYITATARDAETITDKVFIRILGPQATLKSAITGDVTGNGYLDRITLVFDKKVALTDVSTIQVSFGNTTNFPIDSMDKSLGDSSAVFILYLKEVITPTLQTSWKPHLSISGIPDVDQIDNFTCQDGAGPVIVSVFKEIVDIAKRGKDLVTVKYSEPIKFANGNGLSISLAPVQTFTVWTRSENSLDSIAGFFDGINSLSKIIDSVTIQFYMENGKTYSKDLTDKHYLSFKTNPPGIGDASSSNNVPVTKNQRVQVQVSSQSPQIIQVAPNPSKPTLLREPGGVLNCKNNDKARTWIREDRSGSLLTFKVMLPTNPNDKMKGQLVIYDMIGNVVNNSFSMDMIPAQWGSAGTAVHDLDMYWNGTNQKGMPVAPGIYRVILTLVTGKTIQKMTGNIGIGR